MFSGKFVSFIAVDIKIYLQEVKESLDVIYILVFIVVCLFTMNFE